MRDRRSGISGKEGAYQENQESESGRGAVSSRGGEGGWDGSVRSGNGVKPCIGSGLWIAGNWIGWLSSVNLVGGACGVCVSTNSSGHVVGVPRGRKMG